MFGKADALGLLFLLLPGFLCAYVTQQLAVRRTQSDTEKVIEALILSFVLYLATLPFFGNTLPLSWQLSADGSYHVIARLVTYMLSARCRCCSAWDMQPRSIMIGS